MRFLKILNVFLSNHPKSFSLAHIKGQVARSPDIPVRVVDDCFVGTIKYLHDVLRSRKLALGSKSLGLVSERAFFGVGFALINEELKEQRGLISPRIIAGLDKGVFERTVLKGVAKRRQGPA